MITLRVVFVLGALLLGEASAEDRGGPCVARLIRTKPPNAFLLPRTETVRRCVGGDTEVSIEDASIRISRSYKQQATIAIRNLNPSKTIKNVEWRLDIYDAQRKKLHDTLYPSDDKLIKPNGSETASQILSDAGKDKKAIPSIAIILVQVSRITYQDGSTFIPSVECKTNDSYDDVTCGTRTARAK